MIRVKPKHIEELGDRTLRELRVSRVYDDGKGGETPMLPQHVAELRETKREAVQRDETDPNALDRMKIGTLRRHLNALGFELVLVAIDSDGSGHEDVVRLRDAPPK